MRVRLKKRDILREPTSTPSYTPKRGPVRSKAQRARCAHLLAVAFMAYGRTFQQNAFLLPRPSRSEKPPLNDGQLFGDPENPMFDPPTSPTMTNHQRKRETQWKRWQEEVVPQLVPLYMEYMSRSKSLRNSPAANHVHLAVGLKVLDFVSELFVNIPPNNTAWCKAHERFLDRLGYKLTTKGSLRKRFGNALLWHNALKDATASHVDAVLNRERRSQLDLEDGIDIADEFELPDPFSSPLSQYHNLPDDISPDDTSPDDTPDHCDDEPPSELGSDEDDEPCPNPFPPPLDRVRPSDFLRARCPLCFGGEFPESRQAKLDNKPDAVVCIDACFTQKHNRQSFHDPPLNHPRSVFLSCECITATKKYVEMLRPSIRRQAKQPRVDPAAEDDGFEHSVAHGTLL
ncbi:hypothetical protein H0H92_008913, partial [Tricholoma furcatifolium]